MGRLGLPGASGTYCYERPFPENQYDSPSAAVRGCHVRDRPTCDACPVLQSPTEYPDDYLTTRRDA